MLARFAIERLFGNTSTSVDGGSDGGGGGCGWDMAVDRSKSVT